MDETKLRAELIRDEGMRLLAYKDTEGLWTVGVGHLLGLEKRMTEISDTECFALLRSDIDWAKAVVVEFVKDVALLEDARQRALVNMAFNLGNRLGQFVKFLAAVNARDWPTAAREMMESHWAEQVGSRAIGLRDMILTGQDS